MAPIVDGLKAKYDGKVAIIRYNVETDDRAMELADQYAVQYVPTFVFLDEYGKVKDTVIGEVPEKTLKGKLDDLAK